MAVPAENKVRRPLSPHLQVYRLQITSGLSILHRMTGAALAIGSLMVIWWILAAAVGLDAYNTAMDFAETRLGTFMMFGWSFSLFYHLCNGIRHLLWDMGYLFKIENAYRSGYAVVFISIGMTILAWACA
ncbi:MAG: succinate dehydrogenase, cytochrome b556 subunit [Alphaproteobacteria bacterium]|nr:succinate dehydrogenase, cytochrome b556 subunit [Alphaproteobacteria bacterium]